MKKFKRCAAAFLALTMTAASIPMDLQAETTDAKGREAVDTELTADVENETTVTAEEVDDMSRLDELEMEQAEDVTQPLYQENEMVTVIVELEEAPVMDYFETEVSTVSEEEMSAGEAVSEFLASEAAKDVSEELLAGQEDVISDIEDAAASELEAQATEDAAASEQEAQAAEDATASEPEAQTAEEEFEVVAQWTTVTNAMAVKVPYGALDEIKALDSVKRAYVEHTYDRPEPIESSVLTEGKARETYSYDMADVEAAWADGYTGKGMLVAVLDSGLDIRLDQSGNVVREHEAFTEESFRNDPMDEENGWELRYTSESMAKFLEENQLAATTGAEGNKIVYDNNALFKNRKVPYACDYADGDLNVLPTDSDHGTHVSGTIAGYAKTAEGEVKFTGVAPDAQILFMKVFPDEDGGATESSIVNALEDSLKLGADMINLSLGSDNGYAVDDTIQNDTFARVEASGIVMLTSAGNSAYSSTGDNYDGESLTANPETSMMSSPAVYDSNLSVASIDNAISVQSYFVWTDSEGTEHKVAFADPWSVAMKADFSDKEYPVYLVEGTGTYNDYYNAGFNNGYNNGKTGLALVKRGELSFSDKIQNAMSFTGVNYHDNSRYGVLGVLVYDNDPEGTELISMSVANTSLDSAFISGKDGAALEAALKAGYEVKIQVAKEDQTIENDTYGQMSSYTSWGAGPGLELKPEITAPGGNIWSSVTDQVNTADEGYTGSYSMMSGTSMAAPHMTGISALVRQYLTEKGTVAAADMGDTISRLLVSTAVPQKDENGVYYSPRQQGAGLVNAAAAIETPAYITVDGCNVGKLELSDDPEKKGNYDIKFNVNNISDEEVTYEVSVVLMRPDTKEVDSAWGTRSVLSDHDVILSELSLGEVTAAANSSKTFEKTVSLTEEQKAELSELFENGTYVEGYVILEDKEKEAPNLGLPMLSFFGDWTKAPIFDSASWMEEPEDGENAANNEATWGTSIVGSCMLDEYGSVINYLDLGQNIFSSEGQTAYNAENFTISPNGDGYLDEIDDYVLFQLRNARLVVIEVKDSETGETYFRDWVSYAFKTTYESAYGAAIPYSAYGTFPTWDGTDLDGEVLPSGTTCTFSITAYGEGDYGDEFYSEEEGRYVTNFDAVILGENEPTFNGHAMDMEGDVISFPVTVDTEAPKLENNAVTFYEKDGHTYVTGTVYDEDGTLSSVEIIPYVTRTYKEGYGNPSYVETGVDRSNPFYIMNYYDEASDTLTFTADITEYSHEREAYAGENNYYNYEWTGNLLLSCGDFGANDRSYAIAVDTAEGIVLSQTSALLHPGETFELSVNNNSADTESEITRTSSNPKVATIDEYGKITAVAPGQAVMTVSNGTSSATCVVAVEETHTEVEDFNLSIDHFEGLKPDGELVVKVTDLEPADVVLDEIRWSVEESDEYAENYGEGLISVYKESDDGLSGSLYLSVATAQEALPSDIGTLSVTLNGVTRTMEIGWDDIYTDYRQDDLISNVDYGSQGVYVKQGETAELSAKYRQNSNHSAGDVLTELTGLTLDGADFFLQDNSYRAKLVNNEGYALPESIHVYTIYNYSDGSSYEYEMSQSYYGYSYDAATGEVTVPYTPAGASTQLKIKADGIVSEGNPAGTLSGNTYERPDALFGPFDWTVTKGNGTLELATKEDSYGGSSYEVAQYTPSEPGTSYITASTKDGNYQVSFAVISEPVKADTLTLEKRQAEMKAGETMTINATLSPEPSLEKDAKVVWKSFDPTVVSVDENGVLTAVSEGYAYVKAYTASDNRVMNNCVIHVTGTAASEEPETPSNPETPEEPTTPETPSNPEEPGAPSDSETPSESETPSGTETPSESETLSGTETPSESGVSDANSGETTSPAAERHSSESVASESGTSVRTLTSTKTGGVSLKGAENVLPAGADFTVEEAKAGSVTYAKARTAVEKYLDADCTYVVYDINLLDEANISIHELNGYVSVTMPVPQGISIGDGQKLTVYRLSDDGTLVACETTVKDGVVTFETNHFSTFIFAVEQADTSAATADCNGRELTVSLALLAAGVLALAVGKRKKKLTV